MSDFENAKRRAKYASDPDYREAAKQQSQTYKDGNREKIRQYYRKYDLTQRHKKEDAV